MSDEVLTKPSSRHLAVVVQSSPSPERWVQWRDKFPNESDHLIASIFKKGSGSTTK